MLRWLLRAGVVVAAVVVASAYALAFAADRFFGADYWLVERQTDEAVVALQKSQWTQDHPDGSGGDRDVAEIYGSPLSQERVLFASGDRVLRPEERPGLPLLMVSKASENPLQAKSVYLVARYATVAAAVAGLLGLGALRLLRPRRGTTSAATG